MLYLKRNKGMSMIALIGMIIIILIIAGISLVGGIRLIRKAKIENLMTNMITMRAKAKVYAEEVNAEIWEEEDKSAKRKELYLEKYNMSVPSDENAIISKVDSSINNENGCECYEITKETLEDMGLEELVEETNNGDYVVIYNAADYNNLEILYQPGIEYHNNTYYTLSSIQAELGESDI